MAERWAVLMVDWKVVHWVVKTVVKMVGWKAER